ncbi:MAG: hypothetical protein ACLVAT_09000 [Lachnospiraceae bacterium]
MHGHRKQRTDPGDEPAACSGNRYQRWPPFPGGYIKKTGLTKATISAIVQDLLEEQYIEEIGSDQTQYGRKPILLQFCRQNGYIIALDLGVERTVLMICDLLGQNCRLHQYNCPLERDTSIDFLLQLIRNQIRLLPANSLWCCGNRYRYPRYRLPE